MIITRWPLPAVLSSDLGLIARTCRTFLLVDCLLLDNECIFNAVDLVELFVICLELNCVAIYVKTIERERERSRKPVSFSVWGKEGERIKIEGRDLVEATRSAPSHESKIECVLKTMHGNGTASVARLV